jgi:flagellar assembly protein FliH
MTATTNTSSSGAAVAALEYRDIATLPSPEAEAKKKSARESGPPRISLTEAELGARILQAVTDATRERETQLRDEFEVQIEAERGRLAAAIAGFEHERAEYYTKVEPEIVHLVLAVAAKILHREAQVDRMLVAALAKVAVENLQQRSHVVLRVAPEACGPWREFFAEHLSGTHVEILEDSQLEPDGCLLETELGSADVGIDAQLKEIERGFFDLLAARPEPR